MRFFSCLGSVIGSSGSLTVGRGQQPCQKQNSGYVTSKPKLLYDGHQLINSEMGSQSLNEPSIELCGSLNEIGEIGNNFPEFHRLSPSNSLMK